MSLEMNPEIRAQWCAALRSGDYNQGIGALRHGGRGGKHYCCLGVLTDLYVKAGNKPACDFGGWGSYVVWEDGVMATSVRDWAGLQSINPELRPGPFGRAAEANDSGASFAEIADLIDGGAS